MMKLCEFHNCSQWAQWIAEWPDHKKRIFCGVHKDSAKEDSKDVKLVFVGAIPESICEDIGWH